MTPGNLRALVVEDDTSWQEILSELLMDSGLTVDVANNLNEVLSLLKAQPHRLAIVDLSLTDNHPPNTDGLRVLEAIRSLDPGTQAILFTGFATIELAVSAMKEYGAFTVLRKESFKREEFRALIERALVTAPVSPVLTENTSAVDAAQTINESPALTAGIALVVEDDAGWQNLLIELLVEVGYHTCASSSFGEAMHYLHREKFTLAVVDLLLTDTWPVVRSAIMLKDLAGYRLLDYTRSSRIPTIVVSGIATPADIERAYAEQSIFAHLEKREFDRDTFLRLANEARYTSWPDDKLARLTEREREALYWLTQGFTNKKIAVKLAITPNTVKRHLKAIFEKLEVNTRAAAVAKATVRGVPKRENW